MKKQSTNETMAPWAGVPRTRSGNGLDCQTGLSAHADIQRVCAVLSNRASAAARWMIFDDINAAATPDQLDRLARVLWQDWGNGAIGDDDAQFLIECIDRRRPLERASPKGHLKPASTALIRAERMGSRFTPRQRPRSSDRKASRDRRRMLGGSSVLPATLRCQYKKASARCCALWLARSSGRGSANCRSTRSRRSQVSVGPRCRPPCTRRVGWVI
jgi:hypothetical protein